MEPAEKILQRYVARTLQELGSNPFAFEQEHSLPEDTVRSILNGTKKLGTTLNKAQLVCEALGLELYIGPPRESAPVEKLALDGSEYSKIPLHDAHLSAGSGFGNSSETVVEHLAFRKDWLRRLGVPASAAKLVRVSGDSMQPTVWDGDMILIDTRDRSPMIRKRDGKDRRRASIYALLDNGEARVKRIERPSDDTLVLLSDNSDYSPELRQGADLKALNIIGKVVWWGHTERE